MAGRAPSIPSGRIGGYDVQGKLGAGGMGVVYKALDLKLNRTVALKFLSDDDVAADDRDRLLREARAASALDHPNIAAVHTIEETADGRAFIVMGYYEGETLAAKIRRGPLQPAQAVNIALQIARGLEHAHARNITHRDMKPSNVMITNDGAAKILDFGLARMHGPSASTESASLSGTLLYMSPEQAQGRTLDARSDIWALGVVLYQMLTGRLPFLTDNAASTIVAILNAPPPPMTGVSEELQLIVLKALSKTPEARYQSSSALIRDLENIAVDDRAPTVTFDRGELQRHMRAATQSASGLPVASSRVPLWVAIVLGAVLVLGSTLVVVFGPMRARLFGPQEKHIAVLPFDTEPQDAATQSLADGLAESIAGKLASLDSKQSLWVVPGSEIRRRNVRDVDAARKEFGATLAVKGAVQRIGNGVHITVDLIDTGSMRLLGSASLERSSDTLALLDEDAAASLSRFMALEAHPSAVEKTVGAAYEDYLKGRGYLQRFDKPGNLDEAVRLFETVVKADPRFTLGYAALAEAYLDHYGLDSNSQWLQTASEYCKQAMGLNDKLPAVFVTCGRVHDANGLYDLALSEFQTGLKLDPRSADARLGLAGVYEHLKRDGEAEASLEQAATMRPDYWYFTYQLGAFYTRHRRFPEAEREFRKVVNSSPDSAFAHSNLGSVIQIQGANRYGEAESEFRKSLSLGPTYAAYNNLGTMYYRQKRWADATEMLRKALELNSHDYRVWANLGIAYEWLGQQDKAGAAYQQELPLLEAAARLKPNDSLIQVELAIRYAKLNQREKALSQVEAALARSPDDFRVLGDAAEAYDNLGDRARALSLVSRSLAKGGALEQLALNPGLRGVLGDPKFRAVQSSK